MRTARCRGRLPAALVVLAMIAALAVAHSAAAPGVAALAAERALARGARCESPSAPAPVKPSSLAPHQSRHGHAYGAPIQPPILKHRTTHHKPRPAPAV